MIFHVTARNAATDSENRMHDDMVARTYGYRGGLVPGVTVYGYVVSRLPVEWREQGFASLRLMAPVYDGDTVVVRYEDDFTAEREDGTICARVSASLQPRVAPFDLLEGQLPDERPAASRE